MKSTFSERINEKLNEESKMDVAFLVFYTFASLKIGEDFAEELGEFIRQEHGAALKAMDEKARRAEIRKGLEVGLKNVAQSSRFLDVFTDVIDKVVIK